MSHLHGKPCPICGAIAGHSFLCPAIAISQSSDLMDDILALGGGIYGFPTKESFIAWLKTGLLPDQVSADEWRRRLDAAFGDTNHRIFHEGA